MSAPVSLQAVARFADRLNIPFVSASSFTVSTMKGKRCDVRQRC